MINIEVKQLWFDSPRVIRAVDKAKRRVLSRAGAWIRNFARYSMRRAPKKGPKHSRPGKPPFVHTGLLKNFLFFSWDPTSKTVVVGPEKLGAGEAPRTLEYGGPVRAKRWRRGKRVVVAGFVKPRPYMAPALAAELPMLPARWRDSVRASV